MTLVNPTITVSPATVCLGETITFDFIGVVEDIGGIMRVDCVMKTEIPGVTPTYTWRITKPDGATEPPSSDPPGSGPTATFAGMPPNSNDFGRKTITVSVDGLSNCQDTQVVESVYPGTATNHPESGVADPCSARSTNCFFDWNQTGVGNGNAVYSSMTGTDFAQTPAMLL